MRDFDWFDKLYAVIKEDGSFAGRPCVSLDEAKELSNQHEGSKIYLLQYHYSNFEDDVDEPDNIDGDCGFDPYMGCFSDDC
jgi:hypothetical protein